MSARMSAFVARSTMPSDDTAGVYRSTIDAMMRRAALALVPLALGLAGCGDGKSDTPVSDAMCADLRAGMTAMNIYGGVRDRMSAEEFAGKLYGNVAIGCPDQFRTNQSVRAMVKAWGYDPDNVPKG